LGGALKISVELDDERYKQLHALKGKIEGHSEGGWTHAALMRAALDLLLETYEETQHGAVVGVSSGLRQRTKRVLAEKGWSDRMALLLSKKHGGRR